MRNRSWPVRRKIKERGWVDRRRRELNASGVRVGRCLAEQRRSLIDRVLRRRVMPQRRHSCVHRPRQKIGHRENGGHVRVMPSITGEPGAVGLPRELHSVQDIGVVAGPAVGAGILAVTSPATAFGVNAATFAIAAITFRRIRQRSSGAGESAASPLAQFIDGMRAVRRTPYVPLLTILTFVGAFTYGAQM